MAPSSNAGCVPWESATGPPHQLRSGRMGFAERLIGSIRRECYAAPTLGAWTSKKGEWRVAGYRGAPFSCSNGSLWTCPDRNRADLNRYLFLWSSIYDRAKNPA